MKIENLCINCMQEMETAGGTCEFCGFHTDEYKVPRHHMRPFTVLAGKYVIGKAIGEGGFGITYIGMDLNLEVPVAIKEYYPRGFAMRDSSTDASVVWSCSEDTQEFFEEGRKKFIKEARAVAKFRNLPEIVGVMDFFMENQTSYIVMEYLDGQTLKQYVKEKGGKISANELTEMIRPLVASLGKLHKENLIHRDISPDNIMILKDGNIKLLDFGGARDYASSNGKSMSVMIKHGYAPEEQYMSRGDQGPWTDVYALCATMYYCITGIVPPDALERLYEDQLRTISALDIKCPKSTEKAILKGLSIRKDERYQSMEELYEALYAKKSICAKNNKTDKTDKKEKKKTEKPKKDTENKKEKDEKKKVKQEKTEILEKIQNEEEKINENKSDKSKLLNIAMVIAAVGIVALAAVGIKNVLNSQKTSKIETDSETYTGIDSTTTVYVTNDANIRKQGSLKSEIKGLVYKGTSLEAVDFNKDSEWTEIRFKGKDYYINSGYISKKVPKGMKVTEGSVLDTSKELSGLHHAKISIMNYGDIFVELDADTAPITVTNFVKLSQEKFYNGLSFWRIMDGFMMQGGDPDGNGTGGSGETIKGEFASNGIKNNISHLRGTISMARSNDPDSASSQFFIVQSDSIFLDGEYAAFGYVTKGMEIVDEICKNAQPTDDNGTIKFIDQPMIERITVID